MMHLLFREPRARLFFWAHAQSSLGTGAGIVGLLLVAYDRYAGAWGITLVLLADFLPAILLGPIFGAAADRWSRRTCAVVSDLLRATALIGIALVGSIEATVALALLAGLGAGLFQPAILAGVPSLVDDDQVPAAMSLYGSIREAGMTIGPALAALALLLVDADTLVLIDGVTFALSACLLATLRFGGRPARVAGDHEPKSLLADAREGVQATAHLPGVRTLIGVSSAVLLFVGMFGVGELLFAKQELGAGDSGYAIMVGLGGAGVVLGSLLGAREGTTASKRRRYLAGVAFMGAALLALSVTPEFALACPLAVLIGVGNGLVLVYGRVLIQAIVPDSLLGRVFGINDAATSAAFGVAFLSAGFLISLLGTREVLALSGAGALLVWIVASLMLRRSWPAETSAAA